MAAALLVFTVQAAPGDLDTTFETDGIYVDDLGNSDESIFDVAVQPDGKSILVGYCQDGTGRNFCIVRLNEDGTYDEDFDGDGGSGNGIVLVSMGSGSSYGTGVVLQPDGDIIVAGYCEGDSSLDFCVVRLLEDGTLDSSFGTGGRVIIEATEDSDIAPKVALQLDGKVVIAGQCGSPIDFCVVRLLSTGAVETGFAVDGIRRVDFEGFSDQPSDLVLQDDGMTVVVGTCYVPASFDFCALRVDQDGNLDPNFDGDGKKMFTITDHSETATGVALDSLDRIVIGGYCGTGSELDDFCVARLMPDGSYDLDFIGDNAGPDGRFTVTVGDFSDFARDIVIQPDGAIVLAGYCDPDDNGATENGDFCLVMLTETGTLDTDFSGDGKVFTTVTSAARANAMAFVPGTPVSKILLAGFCLDDGFNMTCAARYETTGTDPDADNDGVDLPADLCPGTGAGESVNLDGCSANDLKPIECASINLTNVIEGTSVGQTINGTNANDLIIGNGGPDTINGRQGDDCIVGGDDIDRIDGGLGNDVILGGAENDTLKGGDGRDVIFGGDGDDIIEGGNQNDSLNGEDGNDTISGGNGDDYLNGGFDNDTLSGGNNSDTLIGSTGTDKLNGGASTDKCTPLDSGGTRTLCEQVAVDVILCSCMESSEPLLAVHLKQIELRPSDKISPVSAAAAGSHTTRHET